jgi:hypothetical protein
MPIVFLPDDELAHKMWPTDSTRRIMLGAVTVARARAYLAHILGYIIAF